MYQVSVPKYDTHYSTIEFDFYKQKKLLTIELYFWKIHVWFSGEDLYCMHFLAKSIKEAWHYIHVLYKRIINKHCEVCVTLAKSGKGKNCTAEMTILFLEIFWTETKKRLRSVQRRSCQSVLRKSFGKPQEGITRKCRKRFVSQYRIIEKGAFCLKVSSVSKSLRFCPDVGCENFGEP